MFASRAASDLISVIEALYDVEKARAVWLRGVLKAAASAFDQGAGVGLVLYDISEGTPRVDAIDGVNVDPRNYELGADLHDQADLARTIVDCYRENVCATLAEQVQDLEQLRLMRERYALLGLRDQVLVNGANPSGFGCALYVFSETSIALTAAERELMTRLAAHLATSYRLQRRLAQTTTAKESSVAAVLKTDGQLDHAGRTASSGEARRSLTGAVQLREWARASSGRSDPGRATAAWKPLVSARWSLVDRYERDGTRYITARENEPVPAGLEAFSPRERQVTALAELGHSNKIIAYELGLAHSTVRVLLARAAAKLGVHTRSEMIDQIRARG